MEGDNPNVISGADVKPIVEEIKTAGNVAGSDGPKKDPPDTFLAHALARIEMLEAAIKHLISDPSAMSASPSHLAKVSEILNG